MCQAPHLAYGSAVAWLACKVLAQSTECALTFTASMDDSHKAAVIHAISLVRASVDITPLNFVPLSVTF